MPQTITKTSKEIVKEAMASVPAISAEEALPLVGSTDHVFVDLRDGTEQAKDRRDPRRGRILPRHDGIPHLIRKLRPTSPNSTRTRPMSFTAPLAAAPPLQHKAAMEMGLSHRSSIWPAAFLPGKKPGAIWSESRTIHWITISLILRSRTRTVLPF